MTNPPYDAMEYDAIFQAVHNELRAAKQKFHAFNSGHEGYAVLLEEVDELWELVRASKGPRDFDKRARKECVQIAAMALRFALDLSVNKPAELPTSDEAEFLDCHTRKL